MKRRERGMIGVRTWRSNMEVEVDFITKDFIKAAKHFLFNLKEDFLGAAFTFRI